MNVISGAILVVLLLTLCCAPRRWALLAMVASLFVLTQGHSLSVAGLNVYPLRIMETVALCRVVLRGELRLSRLSRIDWALLTLYTYVAVVWSMRAPEFSPQQFGMAVDPTLCYLGFRGLIASPDDVRWVLGSLVFVLVPYTALVFLERLTGHSSFALVGHPALLEYRNGVPRCQGSFRHPILLGSVAASLIPLYAALALDRRRRATGLLAALLCLALIFWSNSGGAVTAAAVAAVGWVLWPIRMRLRLVRRWALVILLALAFTMKAPVWYLPFKISQITGGGGYHRGWLMDIAWQDLHKWWFAGMEISETASWFPYTMTFGGDVSGADITNQFLVFGLRAGLGAIALLIILLALAFRAVGQARATFRLHRPGRPDELLIWGVGVTLAVHIANWLGVSYFDQSWAVWLFHVATASALVTGARLRRPLQVEVSEGALIGVNVPARSSTRQTVYTTNNHS